MKRFNNLSFISRIGLAMTLSLFLNLASGYFLKNRLSQKDYILKVEVDYNTAATMELHFDSGQGFNPIQKVAKEVAKGNNSLEFPFRLEGGELLKFLRLDFGNNPQLSEAGIKILSLSMGEKALFNLGDDEITGKIGLLKGVEQIDRPTFKIDVSKRPLDPYIVFSPVNELIYSSWQRTLLLIAPWLLLFFLPVVNWFRERFDNKEFALVLAALFLASIPLKIAWVTFTSLLLLAYALIEFARTRSIKFDRGHLAVLSLFAVPLFFLGQGQFSDLAIPLGFVLFPLICSTVDFSGLYDEIKKIYTKVFFMIMSIAIVSWLLLMAYNGYFYDVNISNYFMDIKSHAHLVMHWLYYPHTTFLSFFILVGGIFCFNLYKRQKITRTYGLTYLGLTIAALLILGSRFAWGLAILLPLLFLIPIQHLKRILVPLWASLLAGTIYFIDKMDLLRTELWQISFTEIKKNLWLGHGTGNSGTVLPDQLLIDKAGTGALIEINHSHNQFLTYLLENGGLGTSLAVALLLFIFYQYAKRNNKVMILVTFSFLLLMVAESPFKTATPLYLFSFLMCLFMGADKRNKQDLADNG